MGALCGCANGVPCNLSSLSQCWQSSQWCSTPSISTLRDTGAQIMGKSFYSLSPGAIVNRLFPPFMKSLVRRPCLDCSAALAMSTVCLRRYLWITIIYNVTYSIALYALVLFYMGTHELLAPFNPLLKFAVVKAVVFLTFWQVSLISTLGSNWWLHQSVICLHK